MRVSAADKMRYFIKHTLWYRWRRRDILTGLLDHRKLHSDFLAALQDSTQVAYILADLDEFKRVNDSYGYDVGNRVLRGVAMGLARKCAGNRSCLGPYREGGESFSVILTNVDAEAAMRFADALRAAVEQVRIDQYFELKVTARLAVVTAPVYRHYSGAERYFREEALKAVYCHPDNKKPNGVVHVAWQN